MTVPQTSFGPTRGQRVAEAVTVPLGVLAGYLLVAGIAPGLRWYSALVVFLGALLTGTVVRAAADAHQGLTVSPYGLRVRRGMREVDVPWAEVQDVVVRRSWLGTRSVRIVTARRTLRTPYPRTFAGGRDPDFDAKVDGIRSWWATFRP